MHKLTLPTLAALAVLMAASVSVQADPPSRDVYNPDDIIMPQMRKSDPRTMGAKAYFEALENGQVTKAGRKIDSRILSALSRRKAAKNDIPLAAASEQVLASFGLGDSPINVNFAAFELDDYTADEMEQSPLLETLATVHADEADEPMTKARYDVLMDLGIMAKKRAKQQDVKIGITNNSKYDENMAAGRHFAPEQSVKIRTATPTVDEAKYGN